VAAEPEKAVMVVSDRRRLRGRSLAGLARAAGAAGADWLQVREKDLAGGALLELVREVTAAAAGSLLRVSVNGRPDVAHLARAHGVHLPEHGLPARDVREAFPGLVVGVSCHGVEGVRRAEQAGAHYAVVGPVFPTTGKDRPLGLEALAEAARAVRLPVFAIGGITPANAASVWAAGAAGVGAIGAFLHGDTAAAVRLLKEPDGRA
jgi:thiamine-phosphate pyrophosphorylase